MTENKNKRCKVCAKTLPIEQFALVKNKDRNPYRMGDCNDCRLAIRREQYQEEREKRREKALRAIAAVAPPPCERCHYAHHCKTTGYTCIVFAEYVETGASVSSPEAIARLVHVA